MITEEQYPKIFHFEQEKIGNAYFEGHGDPNGIALGNVGDRYLDIDTRVKFVKIDGNGTTNGWA